MKNVWENDSLERESIPHQTSSSQVTDTTNGDVLFNQAFEAYEKGELSSANNYLLKAQDNFKQVNDSLSIAQCQLLAGRMCRDLGNFDQANNHFSSVFKVAKHLNAFELIVDSLNLQASIFSINGEDDVALDYLTQALEIAVQKQYKEKSANILTNMGKINLKFGDYSSALENTKRAYSIFETINPNGYSVGVNLINIGNIYKIYNDLSNAKQFYEKAHVLGLKTKNFKTHVMSLNNLGLISLQLLEYAEALRYFSMALDLSQEKNHRRYAIDNLEGIGKVYNAQGEYYKAIEVHSQALAIAQELGEQDAETELLVSLGEDYIELSQYQKTIEYLNLALEIAQELEHPKTIYEIHNLLSSAYEKQCDLEKAFYHHKEYHKVEKEVFNEKSEETTRQLTVKFDLERTRLEAEQYRLSSEVAERAAQEAEKIVQIRTRELEGAQLEVVMRLAQAAELRDEDTGEHTFRVGRNAAAIAYCLGWSEEEVKVIYLAARLHDVGKIGISDTILLKPGKLTDDEFELMRQHTVIGAKMLSNGQSALLRMAEKIALAHHERWDGNGYPNKIAGEAIPIVARIVSVADVLDALTHSRPYKKAWTVEETLAEIERNSGRQFDPNIVRIAVKIFSGENCISPVAKPSDWEETFKELQNLFGLSRFSM